MAAVHSAYEGIHKGQDIFARLCKSGRRCGQAQEKERCKSSHLVRIVRCEDRAKRQESFKASGLVILIPYLSCCHTRRQAQATPSPRSRLELFLHQHALRTCQFEQ